MKLKSVDINAFRLFDQVHVDFTKEQADGERQSANFVTIYAPNGFGKTSLFDAIEFGMTSNIHRLKLGNFKEQLKYDAKASNFASFIHNKKKPDERVSVRLELEDFKDKVVEEVVEPNNEKALLSKDGHNAFFTNAILSQDWFSEFLTASTAEVRFESFMRNFHQTGDLLNYLGSLKTTHKRLGNDKVKKQKVIDDKKKELNNEFDDTIIERMCDKIKAFAELGVKLKWNRKVDEESLTHLKMDLEGVEARVGADLKKHQQVLTNCQKVINGQDGLTPLKSLKEQKQKIEQIKAKIAEKEADLNKIKQVKSLLGQRELLENERKACIAEIERLKALIERYIQYSQQQESLIAQDNIVKDLDAQLKLQNEELKRIEVFLRDNETLKKLLDQQLATANNKLEKLDEDYAAYLALLAGITQNEKTVSELDLKATKLLADRDKANKRLSILKGIQQSVSATSIQVVIEDYKEQSQAIISLQQSVKRKLEEIKQLEDGIRQKTSYQNQVKELLVRARSLVDELRNGVCPLCGYDYGSVDLLLKSIEDNNAIATSIEDALARIATLKKEVEEEKTRTEELYKTLASLLIDDIKVVTAKVEATDKDLRELSMAKAEKQRDNEESKKKIAENYSHFTGLSKEQVKQQYETTIAELGKKIQELENTLTSLKGHKEEISKITGKIDENRKAALAKINKIISDKDYLEYKRLLGDNQTVDENSPVLWKKKLDETNKTVGDYDEKMKAVEGQLERLKEEKVDLTEEIPLTEEKAILDAEKEKEEGTYAKTILFIGRECNVKDLTFDTPVNEIAMNIGTMVSCKEEAIKKEELKQAAITEFGALIGSAEKYNHQQRIKKEIAFLEEEKKGMEDDQKAIKAEEERLQDYLTKYVKNFFQEDLINDLYNRIDPHPEYKEVKFECDFSLSSPRLIVYMGTRKEGEADIVPNLYFSTAQVNILSFCIFLAKAMFAKTDDGEDVGCIFIDDPIQALDDINILSMIDLLRNVAFKMKKQVILTTHDQNFFGLLQKKMPQDKFNACYLEIYERGKFRKI